MSGILTDSCLKFNVFAFSAPDFAARRTIVRLARRNRTLQTILSIPHLPSRHKNSNRILQTILSPRLRDSEKHKAKKLECTWNWFKVRRIMWKKLRTCMPPPWRGISAHWAAQRLNQRRGCWKLKNLLPNYYFSIRISKTDEAISDFSKEIIIRFFYRRKSPLQLFYFFTTVGCSKQNGRNRNGRTR